jgi:PAS domain S-box-containing protein
MERLNIEDRVKVKKQITDFIQQADPKALFLSEQRMVRSDGETRWFEARGRLRLGTDGRPEIFLGTFLDITRYKRIENQLRTSEQRFRELAELLPQTVYEMDLDGRLTYVNQFAYKMFGYSPEDFEKGLNAMEMLIPDDRERVLTNIARIINGQELPEEAYTGLGQDGTQFPVRVFASPIKRGDTIEGLRGIVVDMSEQAHLLKEKSKLEEQYQQAQKMEAIGRLAGGVAHDLNNLLLPILGYAEILLEDFSAADSRKQSIEQIHRAGLRAKDLVRQLLAFGRKQALEVKIVDLNRVIGGFEKLLRRTIREDIEIRTTLPPGLSAIRVDVGQIEQIIMNLSVNAQDAMPEGGCLSIETGEIEIDESYAERHRGAKPGRFVKLTIKDTGQGMTREVRERIFEPFFTTKEKGKGTGLGLSTVYGIVKQHDGYIWVYSEPGKGAAFELHFPAMTTAALEPEEAPVALRRMPGAETIMVVEDEDNVRKLTASILKRQGYTVLSAASGEQCLNLLSDHKDPLHLLLTDVIMPSMNGRELFEKLVVRFPTLKVLYMSGYADDVIGQFGVLEEGLDFIQKPFSIQKLAAKVRSVLDAP